MEGLLQWGLPRLFKKKYFCTIFLIHLGFSQLTIETCYPNLLIQNHDYLKLPNEKSQFSKFLSLDPV